MTDERGVEVSTNARGHVVVEGLTADEEDHLSDRLEEIYSSRLMFRVPIEIWVEGCDSEEVRRTVTALLAEIVDQPFRFNSP